MIKIKNSFIFFSCILYWQSTQTMHKPVIMESAPKETPVQYRSDKIKAAAEQPDSIKAQQEQMSPTAQTISKTGTAMNVPSLGILRPTESGSFYLGDHLSTARDFVQGKTRNSDGSITVKNLNGTTTTTSLGGTDSNNKAIKSKKITTLSDKTFNGQPYTKTTTVTTYKNGDKLIENHIDGKLLSTINQTKETTTFTYNTKLDRPDRIIINTDTYLYTILNKNNKMYLNGSLNPFKTNLWLKKDDFIAKYKINGEDVYFIYEKNNINGQFDSPRNLTKKEVTNFVDGLLKAVGIEDMEEFNAIKAKALASWKPNFTLPQFKQWYQPLQVLFTGAKERLIRLSGYIDEMTPLNNIKNQIDKMISPVKYESNVNAASVNAIKNSRYIQRVVTENNNDLSELQQFKNQYKLVDPATKNSQSSYYN